MLWQVIISGFVLGATGSMHCIGMCGPLSLMIPVHDLSVARRNVTMLAYQLGRIISYTLTGVLLGLAGRVVFLSGYQQVFSLVAGIVVLLMAIGLFAKHQVIRFRIVQSIYNPVQRLIARLLHRAQTPQGSLLLGMANGVLPCGMVYLALITTLTLKHVTEGALFMMMFGIGTVPAMMLVATLGHHFGQKARPYFRKAIPYMVFLTGTLLVLRGMNLDIMFLSPGLPLVKGGQGVCHP